MKIKVMKISKEHFREIWKETFTTLGEKYGNASADATFKNLEKCGFIILRGAVLRSRLKFCTPLSKVGKFIEEILKDEKESC